jgi:signal peptidase I
MGIAGVACLAGLAAAAGALALAGTLRRRLAIVAVFGPSMQPTLAAGDRVLVRRASIGEVRPGQIVVFERPGPGGNWVTDPPRGATGARAWMIKRVAATPGDRIPDDILPALHGPGGSLVPPGRLVVLGDNTANSHDSRLIGYIPAERLLGVMLRPIYPSR